MNNELKKAIVNFILENVREFQLAGKTITEFRPYIYKEDGDYLIGGREVSEFIDDAIKLLTK